MLTPAARLRALIARELPSLVPLVLDPLSAVTAEAAGFEALYLGGGAMGYRKTGTEANLSLTQMCQTIFEIRAACDLPIILDGQCGWGDAMHAFHTIRMAEAAGAAGIEIEDQLVPKRAHHHIGIEHLVPLDTMLAKIRAAVAARRDPDFVLIARTNACRSEGIEEAIRRAEAFRAAGADMVFLLHRTPEEARAIGERLGGPLYYMMLDGPASVGISREDMGRLGYRLMIDSITALFAQQRALRLSYAALMNYEADPTLPDGLLPEMEHLHGLIGLDTLLEIERQTVERRIDADGAGIARQPAARYS